MNRRSWDRQPFVTKVRNGSASAVLAYNHLISNLVMGRAESAGGRNGGGFDTDDGTDYVNATSNVVYLAALWKSDFGGHTKTYSNNVNILGGACGCGTNINRFDYPGASTDRFVGNRCIGSPSTATNCSAGTALSPVMRNNSYFLPNVTRPGPTPLCPGAAALEHGSTVLPMPTTADTIIMAEEALRMGQ